MARKQIYVRIINWLMDLSKSIASFYKLIDKIRFCRTPGQQAERSDYRYLCLAASVVG